MKTRSLEILAYLGRHPRLFMVHMAVHGLQLLVSIAALMSLFMLGRGAAWSTLIFAAVAVCSLIVADLLSCRLRRRLLAKIFFQFYALMKGEDAVPDDDTTTRLLRKHRAGDRNRIPSGMKMPLAAAVHHEGGIHGSDVPTHREIGRIGRELRLGGVLAFLALLVPFAGVTALFAWRVDPVSRVLMFCMALAFTRFLFGGIFGVFLRLRGLARIRDIYVRTSPDVHSVPDDGGV